jgi:hypothetical protein
MGKISNTSSYPFGTAAANDYVIGTDANSANPDLQTKNYTLGDIAGLAPHNTLQEVLDAGNTATQTMTLNSPGAGITFTNFGTSLFAGDITIQGDIIDSTGTAGTSGQVIKSQGAGFGVEWKDDSLAPPLTATKFWYGDPGNAAVESTNITNDESGAGLLSLGLIASGLTTIDNKLLANVVHPNGDANLMYGQFALGSIVNGDFNTAIGINSLSLQVSGNDNVAIGYRAQSSNPAASMNVSVGNNTLSAPGLLDSNTAIGHYSLLNIDGEINTAVGAETLTNLANGSKGNIAMGYHAGYDNLVSNYNIMIGASAHKDAQINTDTIAIGTSAMQNDSGDFSIAIGTYAAINNSGDENIAMGWSSLASLNNQGCIALGSRAMAGGGDDCIAIGRDSLQAASGNGNIAIGLNSMRNISSTQAENIAIGTDCFSHPVNFLGDNNIGLGFRVFATGAGFDNTIAIGNSAQVGGSDSIAFGNNVVSTRGREFILSSSIRHINVGMGFALGASSGANVFIDNAAATLGGKIVGDIYVVGPTGVGLVGPPATLAVTY